ncbi:MAG TPA: hypothetical protein PLJ47_17295 [Candidatus Hydrogenedentes bacterium]|nr:hypothetical protein [Candidatus Hydrogenedentota bacterium]HRK36356.1 hypothetical protein [Candidatus Hydrogenedentota bacterium]
MLSLIVIGTCALFSEADSANTPPSKVQFLTREKALSARTLDEIYCELYWSEEWSLDSEYDFLFTHHRNWNKRSLFCAYLKLSNGYVLVKQLELGEAVNFQNIKVFWRAQPVPPKENIPLLWIQERYDGTGNQTVEHLYTFADLPPLNELENATELAEVLPHIIQEVEYLLPPAPFKLRLEKGQGYWKGDTTSFGSEGLFFTNYIYNQGDGNCCPSGDKVTGTLKVVKRQLAEPMSYGPIKVRSVFRVETDSFKQAPRTLADY